MKISIYKRLVQLVGCFLPSAIRVFLLRKLLGFQIGKRVHFGVLSIIVVGEIDFGDDVIIDSLTIVYGLKKLRVGDRGRLAVFSRVFGLGELDMGPRTLISADCLVECHNKQRVTMGDYSCFGPRNIVYTHGEYLPALRGYPKKTGDVVLGPSSWTGMNTTILPGTEIGEGTIVAPGAVLTGSVASKSFIRPFSYQHSVVNVENKMTELSENQIREFVFNAIFSIIENTKVNDEELLRPRSHNKLLVYENQHIFFFDDESELSMEKRNIIVGYKLPENVRCNTILCWIDFYYLDYSESHPIAIRLTTRLFEFYNLRFIAKRHEVNPLDVNR